MPLAYPQRASIPRPALPDTLVLAAVALLLLAGAAGRVPALAVVALAGAASCALAGARLSWLTAVPPPIPAPVPTRSRAARRRAAPPRRVAVLLDAAVVTAGLTAAVLPLAEPGQRSAVVVSGLAASAALFVAGLPPVARRPRPSARVRLRGAVDATAAGLGLVLAGWLLLPRDPLDPRVRFAVAVALGGLALAVLTVLTGPHRRTGAARCRGGAALTLSGLVVLAALQTGTAPERAALVSVPPLVGGVLLTAAGARRATRPEPDPPAPPTRVWPRAVVPAAAAVAAVGWQLRDGGPPDLTAVLLALALAPPLVLRDLLRADGPAQPTSPGDPPAGHRPADPDRSGAPVDRPALLRALAALRNAPAPAGALLVVDLDGPGPDGHQGREDVLAEVLRRARAVVGPRDLLADVTATGFAVVTEVGPVLAYALGTRLLAALTEPYPTAGGSLRLRAGIGLAEIGNGGPEDVLRQADLARRRAVQLGRDRVEWYDAYLEEQLVRRLDLERELPGAVARGELDLVYQPVLDLADRQPVGTEALLRWRSPVLGTVLPAEFLPVAEDLDVVGELGCWVLDRACRQLAAWSTGSRQLWMAVNVTVRELASPDFVPRTAAVLDAYGLSPDRLVVEVAEPRVGAELPTVVARLAGLRSLGVRTALDDFRAEHASLAQLRRLPIDLLKVGPQLVDPADPQRPLIDVVVNVGDRLGLDIVAEELESASLLDGARRAGCRYGQGFALARPATAERVEAYFEEFPSASR
ncbi:bifunctional diguanylate cyclase/phosphodiesterase [Micromonospora sp. DSM 115977]|uniref:Bifunctional diguanylate cyclase/phosphodiesterase n=1 Tax=Micromonospora reichwaldensis TaxID=3075516 RepID=A0ABU2WUT4_9ACTN|nr:bifunctional diguanylate cyclase/phosphodiesterase [Micromonospora sp. DSM 115977]MDT0528832.1 bifunctional diguanylate cyclase/phosphodiesterase [Micromonospora sp. DSM 115977]